MASYLLGKTIDNILYYIHNINNLFIVVLRNSEKKILSLKQFDNLDSHNVQLISCVNRLHIKISLFSKITTIQIRFQRTYSRAPSHRIQPLTIIQGKFDILGEPTVLEVDVEKPDWVSFDHNIYVH